MKTFLTVILLTTSLETFGQSNETLLIFPYGKYSNWTNWNLKYLTFKKSNDRRTIDTTYNLESSNFTTHHVEKIEDYPRVSQFLDKALTDYRELKRDIDQKKCKSLASIYIKCIQGPEKEFYKFDRFTLTEQRINNYETILANFQLDKFKIEIFGKNRPTKEQESTRILKSLLLKK